MSDTEFEKLIKNLRSLKKEIELRLRYKGEVTQFELNLKAEIENQLPQLGIRNFVKGIDAQMEQGSVLQEPSTELLYLTSATNQI